MRIVISISILIVLIFSNCNKSIVGPDETNRFLFITVVDENNKPVEDVSFHYMFGFSENLKKTVNTCPATVISYMLPRDTIDIFASVIYFNTTDTCIKSVNIKNDSCRTEFNSQLRGLSNGFYEYILNVKNTITKKEFYILNLDYAEITKTKSHYKTDKTGELSINNINLGIGKTFPMSGPDSPETIGYREVKKEITICLCKDGYNAYWETISIDPKNHLSKTIKLTKKI